MGGNGGSTGTSSNTISQGGNAGNVTAGNGTYVADGAGSGGLINLSLLNGIGGSNIISPSIGGPSIGLGGIFEADMAGNGGNIASTLVSSLLGKSHGGDGGNTGDSTNTVSQGGDAGAVAAGNGTYVGTGDAGTGGLIDVSALNGLGGSNILSPSIGGPSVGLGAIFEKDVGGDGGNAGSSLLSSLFGNAKGGDGGNTGGSTNTISNGGDAGAVNAGDGMFAGAGNGGVGGLINAALLNGVGGSNILSPSIGGPSVGLGAILENDVAGDGGHAGGNLISSLFGTSNGGDGGNTGNSTNTVSKGGDAGDVTAGNGGYVATGDASLGGLINVSALNGLGGSNILSPSVGGPSVGLGAIFEKDVAGDGGHAGGNLLSSLFGNAKGGDGGNTGDSTNTISQAGDAGAVTAGDGGYFATGDADLGGLINVSALNGLGGSNILSPSIGGSSVGLGAIFEKDMAGDGGSATSSLLSSLFGNAKGGDGGSTGDSTNTVSDGGDASSVTAGDGMFAGTADTGLGGLINAALLNGVGGSNILSPSVGGPSVGLGAIFERDAAGDGGDTYDGHVPIAAQGSLAAALGQTLDLLTTTHQLFDMPAIDFNQFDGLDS